jgi:hypothetical protein
LDEDVQMIETKVIRSDAELTTTFSPRLWSLFHEIPRLYEGILESFEPVGVSTSEVRPDAGDGSLGAGSVGIYIIAARANVRVRLENATLTCPDLSLIDRSRLVSCVDGLISCLKHAEPRIAFKGHTVSYSAHISLGEHKPEEFIAQFIQRVPEGNGIGRPLAQGVAFYYGESGVVLSSSFTLERSALFDSAVWVRCTLVLSGDIASGEQIVERAQEGVLATLKASGLPIQEVL